MDIRNKEHIEKIYFFSFIAALVLLPWSVKLSQYVFLVVILAGLFTTNLSTKIQQIRLHPQVAIFFLLYCLYVIGLLYTPDWKDGLSSLEQKLGLVIIPCIMVTSISLGEQRQKTVMMFFVYSNVVITIACVVLNIVLASHGQQPQINFDIYTLGRYLYLHGDDHTLWLNFSYIGLSRFFLPPTYLSTFLTFCIIILAYQDPESKTQRFVKYLTIGWFVIFIVMLSSRIGIIQLMLASTVNLFLFLLPRKFPVRESVLSAGFILVICLLIVLFPVSRFRFIEEPLTTSLTIPTDSKEWNSINLRLLEWKSAIQEIREHGLTGTGTGGTLDALEERYEKANLGEFERRYNAHNQYMETYLEIGLPGFLTFIGCLGIPLLFAIKHKNKILLTLVLMIGTACLTTCLFEKNRGLIFYVSFVSLFMFTKPDNHETT
jgi:O-antigen ligase